MFSHRFEMPFIKERTSNMSNRAFERTIRFAFNESKVADLWKPNIPLHIRIVVYIKPKGKKEDEDYINLPFPTVHKSIYMTMKVLEDELCLTNNRVLRYDIIKLFNPNQKLDITISEIEGPMKG